MTTMRLILLLLSMTIMAGCIISDKERMEKVKIDKEVGMTSGALSLRDALIADCVKRVNTPNSEDSTVLRCYSRKLMYLVDIAIENSKPSEEDTKK